jgi:DNA-binding HxlR family transcriptional regulator
MSVMKGYGQFCPTSKAAEILAERWTLLILRELLLGSHRYGDIQRGVPRMSPTLLAKRLKQLEQAGILNRVQKHGDSAVQYELTEAGWDLEQLMNALAHWGYKWVNHKLSREDLDPGFLMWAIRRNLVIKSLPITRTVIYVEFSDGRQPRRWWLVIEKGEADLCVKDPRHEVDLFVRSDVRTLTLFFDCRISLAEAKLSGRMKLHGSPVLMRTMKRWLGRPAAQWVDDAA